MGDQYLTFELDQEVFAWDVARVREILEEGSITAVPQCPEYMRGAINLRGAVVPVIDLRLMFGMGRTPKTVHTCIIVVEVELEGKTVILGTLADSVREVVEMDQTEIQPPPHIGTRLRTEHLKGMGKQGQGFVMILDLDRIFVDAEIKTAPD